VTIVCDAPITPVPSAAVEPTVALTDVRHTFGTKPALSGCSFSARAGQITVLLGPNGAGKTTALRVVTGALTPEYGMVRVFGLDPTTDGEAVRLRCGVVSAKPALYDRLSGLRRAELRAARTDVVIGMAFSNLVMYFIILTSAAVLHAHGKTEVQTADQAAAALVPLAGPLAFIVFSVGLIGAGLLAIPILTGSATYAVKEFFGFGGSLASKPQNRPTFYLVLTLATVAGVVMNFVHLDPIRALFIAAVINGVVAPPLLLLIVVLGADRKVMKRYVSGKVSLALTGIATVSMAVAAITLFVTLFAGH